MNRTTSEQARNRDHDTPVIIKFFEVFGKWSICHKKSGQNAFRKAVNMFDTKQDAIVRLNLQKITMASFSTHNGHVHGLKSRIDGVG